MVLDVPSGVQGVTIPRKCAGDVDPSSNAKSCPIDPYVIMHHKSTFIDQQMLKIQEPHRMVPVGELPRSLVFSCDRYLAGKVIPGMRVTITGIFDVFGTGSSKQKVVL